eukprot:6476152-Amphidinium_carterae.1
MSVKLPTPTQLDGRDPQLSECQVRLYWRISQVSGSNGLSQSTRCLCGKGHTHTHFRDNRYLLVPTEDATDELEDCNELTMSIRKKRDEILSIHKKQTALKLGDT